MKKYFHIFCLITLFLALFVILWGAWVRFSHSGDGCGVHWPLCHNEWIPESDSGKTWIEWFHRASSSVFGLFVLCLTYLSFKYFPKNHKVRFWSLMTLIFTISEALIGAFLVLKGLTGQNTSGLRLFILHAHLVNSLLLVASIVLCFRFSFENVQIPLKRIISLAGFYLLIAFTGSVASLSNTLFPSSSLQEGWMMDFSENSPWIVQFRVWHPVVAVLVGGFFLVYLFWNFKGSTPFVSMKKNPERTSPSTSPSLSTSSMQKQGFSHKIQEFLNTHRQFLLICFLFMGILTGGITLLTLSPVVMKLIHLFVAYSIWILILHL